MILGSFLDRLGITLGRARKQKHVGGEGEWDPPQWDPSLQWVFQMFVAMLLLHLQPLPKKASRVGQVGLVDVFSVLKETGMTTTTT